MKTSVPKIIFFFLVISIAFLCLYIFVLIDIQEFFPKGSELGVLFYRLSVAYISATLFYFIMHYFPQKQRDRIMLNELDIHKNKVELHVNEMFKELRHPENQDTLTLTNYDKERFQEILQNTPIDSNTNARYVGIEGKINIIRHLVIRVKEIDRELIDIEKHLSLISPEVYKEIRNIRSHKFDIVLEETVRIIKSAKLNNQNLAFIASNFVEYVEKIFRFKEEWEKNKS